MNRILYKFLTCFLISILMVAYYGVEVSAQTNPTQSQPGLVITRTIAPINSPNASKADYVATGKDDDRVINQALTSLPPQGGRVLLLEGLYNLSAAIVLNSNTTLSGAGNNTRLVITNSTNTAAIVNNDPVTGNQRITVENLLIIGNKAVQTSGSGIHFRRVIGSHIINIEVRDAKNSGIDLLSGSNTNILSDIRVFSNEHNGLVISDSYNNRVTGLLARDNGNGGLWIFNGEQNILSEIYTFENKYSGIEIQASNNSLSGVISANNAQGGIYLTYASGNYIQGTAHQNTLSGVALNNSRGNTLQVWAIANGTHGIDLYNSSLNLVVNSVSRNNGFSGVGFNGI
ncbi:MAG: yapH, partial [Dehalococcoidia bacterium]|nr:yapH [Dehalococcoidia bacterium]